MNKMKLGPKMIGGFLTVAAIAGLIGLVGINSLNKIDKADTVLYENMTVPLVEMGTISTAFQRQRVNLRDMIRASETAKIEAQIKLVEERDKEIMDNLAAFEKTILGEEVRDAYKACVTAEEKFSDNIGRLKKLAHENRDSEAWAIMDGEGYTEAMALQGAIDKLDELKVTGAKRTAEENDAIGKKAHYTMVALIIAGCLAAVGIGFFLTLSITRPMKKGTDTMIALSKGELGNKLNMDRGDEIGDLCRAMDICTDAVRKMVEDSAMLVREALEGHLSARADAARHEGDFRKIVDGVNKTLDAVVEPINEVSAVLDKVAQKDLGARVKGAYKGDFSRIKESLNKAVDNLDQSIQQVSTGAEQVASAAGQIGSGSQSLAQGASEQASSLEEISSSLQEVTSMTKQNTANAREARGLSDAAKKGADRGVENMKNLSAAVDKIKKSSDDTAKIVKTIDEIAFQTNLLALNAAVEAARAGDAGKGFAVVAEEVRNLAMRSAEAAKNTANMIEESVKNAENGVALNGEVMKNFEEITTQANKVSEVMAEIAAASEQQSQGIEQVNTAVQQMSQLTQQSAANSEESASAAQELSSQSQEMQSMVGTFLVSGEAKRAKPANEAVRSSHPAPAAAGKPGVRKVLVAAGARKEPASVIPFGDDKDGLKSF